MRVADLGDVRLNWREDGDLSGTPVVFANSLGTDLRLWDDVIPLLPDGFRYIRYDKRGHGLSSCPLAPYAMDDLIGDAERLLDHLVAKHAIFVGLSIGGMIGQGLASGRPDLVKALVLSNTAAKFGEASMWNDRIAALRTGGIEALAEAVLDRWFGASFRHGDQIEAWGNMLRRTPLEGYIGCCAAIAGTDLSAATAQLKLPVLGIAGAEDGASPPTLVQSTIDLIAGARMETIAGAGHLPCVEKPADYARLLTAFLKEVGNV